MLRKRDGLSILELSLYMLVISMLVAGAGVITFPKDAREAERLKREVLIVDTAIVRWRSFHNNECPPVAGGDNGTGISVLETLRKCDYIPYTLIRNIDPGKFHYRVKYDVKTNKQSKFQVVVTLPDGVEYISPNSWNYDK